jgi:hypothetical protein
MAILVVARRMLRVPPGIAMKSLLSLLLLGCAGEAPAGLPLILWRMKMLDLILVVVAVGFFAVAIAYTRACDRM